MAGSVRTELEIVALRKNLRGRTEGGLSFLRLVRIGHRGEVFSAVEVIGFPALF